MSKLIWAATFVCIVAMPLSALAQTSCQQRCLTNCSGKGNMCVNNCETRCAIYGTARR
ncbi:MAG: hypothetical protein WBE48_09800 [Xanthobacteraceae bacterium]|jgi:hypothetical protein